VSQDRLLLNTESHLTAKLNPDKIVSIFANALHLEAVSSSILNTASDQLKTAFKLSHISTSHLHCHYDGAGDAEKTALSQPNCVLSFRLRWRWIAPRIVCISAGE